MRAEDFLSGFEPKQKSAESFLQDFEPKRQDDRSFEVPTPANIAESQRRGDVARKQDPFTRENLLRAARPEYEVFGPTLEGVATGLAGTGGLALGGPAGAVAAGTGTYGAIQELKRRMGGEPITPGPIPGARAISPELIKDIGYGGLIDVAGRKVLGPAMEKGGQLLSSTLGRISDIPLLGRTQASRIAREAAGQDLPAARQLLQKAIGQDVSAAQALMQVNPRTGQPEVPFSALQSLLANAQKSDPDFFMKLLGRQATERITQLQNIARGQNQTAARQARDEMKRLLNTQVWPKVQEQIDIANIAGQRAPQLAAQAQRFGEAAGQKTEDVRRFTAAGERARATDVTPVPGLPRVSTQITYLDDLARRADDLVEQAATASLRFGEAARYNQDALASLAAHGQRPLTGQEIVQAINKRLTDPSYAGNRELVNALSRVADDIMQWTNNNGIIDAKALNAIRQHSINSYVVNAGLDPKQAKKIAKMSVNEVRPVLIKAMEDAGGSDYGKYLRAYALGEDAISRTKLGAQALALYNTQPDSFVRLVRGQSDKVVEKIFGPGNYNIAKQMGAETASKMRGIARELERDKAIDAMATAGEAKFHELLKDHMLSYSLPNWLNPVITTTNRVLRFLNNKWGQDTVQILTEASKNAKSFDELLEFVPPSERSKILGLLNRPSFFREMTLPTYAGMSVDPLKTDQLGGVTNLSPQGGISAP